MKDYVGNEIEAGMTVVLIRTKPMFGDISELRPKKNGKGFFKPRVVFKQPKACWQIVGEYPIYLNEKNELMFNEEIIDCSIRYPISFIDKICSFDLITIKGNI